MTPDPGNAPIAAHLVLNDPENGGWQQALAAIDGELERLGENENQIGAATMQAMLTRLQEQIQKQLP